MTKFEFHMFKKGLKYFSPLKVKVNGPISERYELDNTEFYIRYSYFIKRDYSEYVQISWHTKPGAKDQTTIYEVLSNIDTLSKEVVNELLFNLDIFSAKYIHFDEHEKI